MVKKNFAIMEIAEITDRSSICCGKENKINEGRGREMKLNLKKIYVLMCM